MRVEDVIGCDTVPGNDRLRPTGGQLAAIREGGKQPVVVVHCVRGGKTNFLAATYPGLRLETLRTSGTVRFTTMSVSGSADRSSAVKAFGSLLSPNTRAGIVRCRRRLPG